METIETKQKTRNANRGPVWCEIKLTERMASILSNISSRPCILGWWMFSLSMKGRTADEHPGQSLSPSQLVRVKEVSTLDFIILAREDRGQLTALSWQVDVVQQLLNNAGLLENSSLYTRLTTHHISVLSTPQFTADCQCNARSTSRDAARGKSEQILSCELVWFIGNL